MPGSALGWEHITRSSTPHYCNWVVKLWQEGPQREVSAKRRLSVVLTLSLGKPVLNSCQKAGDCASVTCAGTGAGSL